MNKIAYYTAYMEKNAFSWDRLMTSIKRNYEKDPDVWHGILGTGLGAGTGYLIDGGKGALVGAGLGGVGGYYGADIYDKIPDIGGLKGHLNSGLKQIKKKTIG